jgi:hypothetical protein
MPLRLDWLCDPHSFYTKTRIHGTLDPSQGEGSSWWVREDRHWGFPEDRGNRFFETMVIGKAIPLQARTGSESSWSFRLPDFKTVGV